MGFFKKLFGAALTAAITVGIGIATGGIGWAAAWGAFGRHLAVNFVLGYLAEALAPKPQGQELRDNTVTSRNPTAARKVIYGTTRVGGTIVYMDSSGSDNKYLHLVVAIAAHELTAIDKIYFADEKVWDTGTYEGDWATHARIKTHLGSTTQTADSDLVSEIAAWTSNHRLQGVAYLYVRLKYDRDKYANGIPNISATVRGKKVWTGATTEYSNNPIWCLRDYLMDQNFGMAIASTELNASSFSIAAAVCDETVTTSTGTQDRYTLDGVVDLSKPRNSIIEQMLSSCAGLLTYSGGEFHVHASKYYAPTIGFDESDIIGAISVQTKQSRRNAYNGVKGVFSSTEDNYVLVDYPPVISSTYATEDGDPLYLDVNLPFTTDPIRAQRLAKLMLLQGRQQISASIPCNLSALKVKAGDFITVSNTHFGWSSKVFRVTGYELNIASGEAIGVTLQVVETSSSIYDWSTSDETPFIAGQATSLPAYYTVNAPSSLSLSNSVVIQPDGTARPAVDISYTNNDAFTHTFEIQYKKGSEAYKSIITSEDVYRLEDITPGATYTIQVRAINRLGARSAFISDTINGEGDSSAPSAPSGLSLDAAFNGFHLSWTNPTDSDLDIIQVYESTSSVQANATLVGTVKGDSFFRGGLSDGVTRWYWVKAVDYSGNTSGFNAATGVTGTTLIPVSEADIVGTIEVVSSLTTGLTAADVGKVEFLTSDQKLYRWSLVTAPSTYGWVTGVSIDDVSGSITANRIDVANLSAITSSIGTLTTGKLQNDPTNPTFIIDLDLKKIYIA